MVAVAERQQSRRSLRQAASSLLEWYDAERRDLPWRYHPGAPADPYRVWLSEIMLQQTTVKAVIPFFNKFLALWPTVSPLAAAEEEDVLRAWAGLGYYSRARNLHKCARVIADEYDGVFPDNEAELIKLPGVGPYTAAAIAAIAFGRVTVPLDGNVERVISRLHAIEEPLPKSKALLRDAAAALVPADRPGDFAQAMMDLGATVCTPKRPSCMMCPLQSACTGHAQGIAARLPNKMAKPERPTRSGVAFLALAEDGSIRALCEFCRVRYEFGPDDAQLRPVT